jgi:hypothetical protein
VCTMVSTDTDGGGYEWYMYEVRTKVSKRHEPLVHFRTMKYMCMCVYTHMYTHTLGDTNLFSTCTVPSCCVTQP